MQDAVGTSTQWHLSKIEVTPASTSSTSTFGYKSYLNQINPTATITQTSMHDLRIVVNTSDNGQGDFDGSLFLSLVGGYSAMDEVKLTGSDLDSAGGVFSAGSALAFSIKCPEIGSLTSATVRVVSQV